MAKHSQKHDNCGKYADVNINIESNSHYHTFEDIHVPEVFKNPDTDMNTASLEQHVKDYIMPYLNL